MKVMFLFFTSLNVIFFLWQFTTTDTVSAGTGTNLTIPKDVKRLVLVTEKKTDQNTKKKKKRRKSNSPQIQVASRSSSSKGKREKYLCYSLGPFEQKKQMTPISKNLRDIGTRTNPRKLKRRVSTGYWVYMPQFDTWKAARMKVIQLEAKGMKDIFIMGRGKMKNAVSLGLFSSRKSAKGRIKKLSKMGVKAKMESQYSIQEEYWLDLNVDSQNQHEIDSINAIARTLTLLELRPRKCG
jgi:hypothetical protein